MVSVETGSRLHFGFQNLSLAHDRLYGGVGVALEQPAIVLEATPADSVICSDDSIRPYLEDVVGLLDVSGVRLEVHDRFDRHIGLGSGTQLSLACLQAVAASCDVDLGVDGDVDVDMNDEINGLIRQLAPTLGRGGRSGVGVAAFESGGFVVDAGHPTERFTTDPPQRGDWHVPAVLGRWSLPDDWRFVLIQPDRLAGPSGHEEDRRMRTVVERADPGIADRIATLLTRRLLPAVVENDIEAFGRAVARLGRLNGAWYADEQGGVYRPPAGEIIERLDGVTAFTGVGQSSWGPTVYGITRERDERTAKEAAERVLDDVGIDGTVKTTRVNNRGATLSDTEQYRSR